LDAIKKKQEESKKLDIFKDKFATLEQSKSRYVAGGISSVLADSKASLFSNESIRDSTI
jgi:hypothetical protein